MKWYKHFSDALDDPFIQELMDEFSHSGYVAWFGLLEIISKENGNILTGKLSIKPEYLKRKLRISTTKLQKIFEFCSGKVEENLEKSQRKPKLLFNKTLEKWNFEVIKMLDLKDNYTKDLQVTSKKLSNHKEEDVEEEKKEEEDVEDLQQNEFAEQPPDDFYLTKKRRKLSGKRLLTFERFWEIFNYKKDKASAADSWLDIPSLTHELVNNICKSAKIEADNRQSILNNGQTPKFAQGWLTARRWEDEALENVLKKEYGSYDANADADRLFNGAINEQ